MTAPRLLVVTIVHRPLDARIHAREIRSMREADWSVTYAAPWSDTGAEPDPNLDTIDLPRAVGRRRLHAIRAARRMLRDRGPQHDLVLIHDPELLFSIAGLSNLPPVVWDVHEDVAASLGDRAWIPRWATPLLKALVRLLERWAERRHHLILAEVSYADRFRHPHPVVRNLPWVPKEVPPPGPGRAVYLGRISRSRGLDTLLEAAELVAPEATIELIGPADPDVEDIVARAHADGHIRWHGFVGNEQALHLIEGATAGLSLLRDEPNFRASLPTKVAEYMARGIPVVTTPLPEAVALVRDGLAGTVVPFDDADAAADAILRYHRDARERTRVGAAGHAASRSGNGWAREACTFADHLENLRATARH